MGVKATAVRALSSALYRAGITGPLAALTGYARRGPSFQVLTFHRVGDDEDPFLPALHTRVFEAQMAHIAQHYRVFRRGPAGAHALRSRAPQRARHHL